MARFDYFVIFAEMRTGSNFLEANINAFDGLSCHGEAFNPHFIGYPNAEGILGITQAQRDADPGLLINAIKAETNVLGGFRFFNNHLSGALDICLPDPRCAKIILTRNPVDSYVSWKIAQATGQWKLTNPKHARSEQIHFDTTEFETHLEALQSFQVRLLNGLQRSGQTAFFVAYEDLQDVNVMNGLATFLGVDSRINGLDRKLKKQNPAPMSEKVLNFAEMESSLARLDRFNLTRTPNFEPRRGPNTPTYIAAPKTALLYMPLRSGPEAAVAAWLAALDNRPPGDLRTGFSQNALRRWKTANVGHRSFTVLRHPVARAHNAFCAKILATGDGTFPEIRATLRKMHGLNIPDRDAAPETDKKYDMPAHRAAFLSFLRFLKMNLAGQTAIRSDPAWGSQLSVLQGMAEFGLPDLVIREEQLQNDLAYLALQTGHEVMPALPNVLDPFAARLAAIYDPEVEAATRDACLRDYTAFGFADWKT